MPAWLSIDSPCRTKLMRIDPSSAQATAGPMDIRAVERKPAATKRSRFRLLITSPFAVSMAASNLPHPTSSLSQTTGPLSRLTHRQRDEPIGVVAVLPVGRT